MYLVDIKDNNGFNKIIRAIRILLNCDLLSIIFIVVIIIINSDNDPIREKVSPKLFVK